MTKKKTEIGAMFRKDSDLLLPKFNAGDQDALSAMVRALMLSVRNQDGFKFYLKHLGWRVTDSQLSRAIGRLVSNGQARWDLRPAAGPEVHPV